MGFGREGTSTVDVGSGGSDVDVIGAGVESAYIQSDKALLEGRVGGTVEVGL